MVWAVRKVWSFLLFVVMRLFWRNLDAHFIGFRDFLYRLGWINSPNNSFVTGVCEPQSCLNWSFKSGLISSRLFILTSLIECPIRARESSESWRNSDTSLLDADSELDFNSSNLSDILTIGIMLFRRFVSSFCIFRSRDLVFDLILLQMSGFTLVFIRFSQFSGLLYFSFFSFVFSSDKLVWPFCQQARLI